MQGTALWPDKSLGIYSLAAPRSRRLFAAEPQEQSHPDQRQAISNLCRTRSISSSKHRTLFSHSRACDKTHQIVPQCVLSSLKVSRIGLYRIRIQRRLYTLIEANFLYRRANVHELELTLDREGKNTCWTRRTTTTPYFPRHSL